MLAPGGRPSGVTLATAPGVAFRTNDALFGTSFAAAFVTGVAARFACGMLGGPCHGGQPCAGAMPREYLLSHLKGTADRNWSEYTRERHGLGLVRYAGLPQVRMAAVPPHAASRP